MPNKTYEAQWETYSEAWTGISPQQRKELLTHSVAINCSFADPDTEGAGLEALTAHIEKFQKDYPGAYFETRRFIEHHGQSVAEWMMRGKDDSEFLPGTSVARYGEDGKITHLAGFWKL
ncbi:MAG: nuclear transport factor 2 family protein [Acidobacteriaceae bacterium]|nr:nuclear transport factor 2 family protein [Acidobacteriaceae bacterium]